MVITVLLLELVCFTTVMDVLLFVWEPIQL